MPKRVHRKRMSRRGGDFNQIAQGTGEAIAGVGNSLATGAQTVRSTVYGVGQGAFNEAGNLISSGTSEAKKDAKSGWSWLFGTDNTAAPPTSSVTTVGGSRRRRRSGRKSKNMFSGLMKMVGFKTKKRGRRGGIGRPYGAFQPEYANFPSAAYYNGQTLGEMSKFDPSQDLKGGCMSSKSIPLSPAPFPGDGMMGGKTKRHRRKRHGGKSMKNW